MKPQAPSKNPKPVLPQSEEPDARKRYRAARAVASAAADAEECAELLAALGLRPEDGKLVPAQRDR
ncbi:hypothetical protein [Qaidamihabitans albus]|uniref:hypothetical protein n=1 Tax=Qaidamihabitans albus TaxID=2795733 RepID=UPI0018F246F9|nr:hypothetical protein [Qaidamihabitans albus]